MGNDSFRDDGEVMYPMITIQEHFMEITYGSYFGVADLGGNIKVPLKDYECVLCDSNFIAVKEYDNEDWQLFGVYNDEIIELCYEEIIYRKGEFFLVKFDGHWEFYDFEDCCEEDEEFYEDFAEDDGDYDE